MKMEENIGYFKEFRKLLEKGIKLTDEIIQLFEQIENEKNEEKIKELLEIVEDKEVILAHKFVKFGEESNK